MSRGFTALKTNIVIPGEPASVYFPGFGSGMNSTDGVASVETLGAIERLIGTFRDAVGPSVGLCLDLNYNFRTEGVLRIGKLLERFDMQWMEYDNWDPQALLQIKQSTSTRLASCESLVSTRQYRPFLEAHAVDVAIIDVPWNGFSQAVQIGRMAEAYETNIAPHNYYSHLADLHSLHLCAVLPNVRIMEIDIDDVPWKAELVTRPPAIKDGHIFVSDAPRLGRRHQRGSAARPPVARESRARRRCSTASEPSPWDRDRARRLISSLSPPGEGRVRGATRRRIDTTLTPALALEGRGSYVASTQGWRSVAVQGEPVKPVPEGVSVRVQAARSWTRAGWPDQSSTVSAQTR